MIEPHEFIRQYFNISDKHTIYEELGSSLSIDKVVELMRSYKEKLETLAQQPLSGSPEGLPKSCRNCGREKYCDYKMGECIGLDCKPTRWIPA